MLLLSFYTQVFIKLKKLDPTISFLLCAIF
jgi:hypothetical protein